MGAEDGRDVGSVFGAVQISCVRIVAAARFPLLVGSIVRGSGSESISFTSVPADSSASRCRSARSRPVTRASSSASELVEAVGITG